MWRSRPFVYWYYTASSKWVHFDIFITNRVWTLNSLHYYCVSFHNIFFHQHHHHHHHRWWNSEYIKLEEERDRERKKRPKILRIKGIQRIHSSRSVHAFIDILRANNLFCFCFRFALSNSIHKHTSENLKFSFHMSPNYYTDKSLQGAKWLVEKLRIEQSVNESGEHGCTWNVEMYSQIPYLQLSLNVYHNRCSNVMTKLK